MSEKRFKIDNTSEIGRICKDYLDFDDGDNDE